MPERLARFFPLDWPDAKCPHEALRMWENACADWLGGDTARKPRPGWDAASQRWWLAGESRRSLPFGEDGDAIDVLREAGRLRQGMPACPHEYRPAVYWVNGPPDGVDSLGVPLS